MPKNGLCLEHSKGSAPRTLLFIVGIHHKNGVSVFSIPRCLCLENLYLKNTSLFSSGPPCTNPACTCYPFTSFLMNRQQSVPAQKHQIPRRCQWIKYVEWWKHFWQGFAVSIVMWCYVLLYHTGNLKRTLDRRSTFATYSSAWFKPFVLFNWLQSSRLVTLCDCRCTAQCSFISFHYTMRTIIVDNGICNTEAKYSINDYPDEQ